MVFGRKKSAVHDATARLPSERIKSRPKKPAPEGCNPYDSTGRMAKRPRNAVKPGPKRAEGDPSNPYDTASRNPVRNKGWSGARSGAYDKE